MDKKGVFQKSSIVTTLLIGGLIGLNNYDFGSQEKTLLRIRYYDQPISVMKLDRRFGRDKYYFRIGNDRLTGSLKTDEGMRINVDDNQVYINLGNQTYSLDYIHKIGCAKTLNNITGIEFVLEQ